MSDHSLPSTVSKPPRNLQTEASHRRETLLQIVLPLLIALLALLSIVLGIIMVFIGGGSQISQWADVSLIWLITLVCPWALIFFLILSGIVYGLTALLKVAPGYFFRLHHFILVAQANVNRYSDKAVEPFLRAKSMKASINYLFSKMRPSK